MIHVHDLYIYDNLCRPTIQKGRPNIGHIGFIENMNKVQACKVNLFQT